MIAMQLKQRADKTTTQTLVCLLWLCASSQLRFLLPLNKYSCLDGVHNAAEARLLLVASQHQAHLTSEGGGQPVPHLGGHRLGLDVAELVLRVDQAPEGSRRRSQE